MLCSICGVEIDTIENAVDEGWIPSFYDGCTLVNNFRGIDELM